MEKVKQQVATDWQQAGTIYAYMGAVTESVSNLSELSDCSSHLEFVTLDFISQVSVSTEITRLIHYYVTANFFPIDWGKYLGIKKLSEKC